MHEDIPNSRLELYPECGHWPQYERVDLYNPMSIAFLRRNDSVPRPRRPRWPLGRWRPVARTDDETHDRVERPRPAVGGRREVDPCPPVRDLIAAGDARPPTPCSSATSNASSPSAAGACGPQDRADNPAVQAQLGVDQPDFGALFAELGHGDGERSRSPRSCSRGSRPRSPSSRRRPRSRTHTVAEVIAATGFLLPVLEIVDSRIAGWDITFVDTVADNASSGRFVLGTVPVARSTSTSPRSRCAVRQRRRAVERRRGGVPRQPVVRRPLARGHDVPARHAVTSPATSSSPAPSGRWCHRAGDRVEAASRASAGSARGSARRREAALRRFSVRAGALAEAGEGRPVVLLHQTPRSGDEFAEVLPILGRHRRALAIDLPGMGASDRTPAAPPSRASPRASSPRRRPRSRRLRPRRPPHRRRRRRGDRRLRPRSGTPPGAVLDPADRRRRPGA